jgi:hypothetical protein
MSPEDRDFLCGGWIWDPVLRELRHHERARKGWKDEPDGVERLEREVASVSWHRWSQPPMRTATGDTMSPRLSRVVVAYDGGGDLTINENDRTCAETLAGAIAEAYGLQVTLDGAPDGRRRGNLPPRDDRDRLVSRSGKSTIILDRIAHEIEESRPRFPFGRRRRRVSLSELRRLELTFEVQGATERFTVWAILGPEDERLPVAAYEGFEGWAEPEEWREFAEELGRRLGAEVRQVDA